MKYSRPMPLTYRELDLLKLVAKGLGSKESGYTLGLSPKTIKNKLHTIYEKMDVHNAPHAVAIAVHRGWLDLDELFKEKQGD